MANKGRSVRGAFGTIHHYDSNGHKSGSSVPGAFGGYTNYDANGNKIGHSSPGMFGGYHHSDGQGCYIDTCVYGSYDCPSVWTLRRFRDDMLAKTLVGRIYPYILPDQSEVSTMV